MIFSFIAFSAVYSTISKTVFPGLVRTSAFLLASVVCVNRSTRIQDSDFNCGAAAFATLTKPNKIQRKEKNSLIIR